ncbi:predicted protein [Chaetoceros tenuissimus]|uniref:DUF3592 domain-containing protein n=1 Tax=Chaetoceros tenuissimus TaxID=426638 RepID=A0AAD3CN57_9STRA|nr:predicted protein [Chaetoceros tenuissimus]
MSDCGGCDDGGGGGCDNNGGGYDGYGNKGGERYYGSDIDSDHPKGRHYNNRYRDEDECFDENLEAQKKCSYYCFGVVFLLIGGCVGGWKLSYALQKVLNWEYTSGTVIGSSQCSSNRLLRKSSSRPSSCSSSYNNNNYNNQGNILCSHENSCSITHAAIISYNVEGTQYEFTSHNCLCNDSQPTVGDEVEVRYDPIDPSRAVSAGFVNLWLLPLLSCLLAIVGLVFIMKAAFKRNKLQEDEPTSLNINQGAAGGFDIVKNKAANDFSGFKKDNEETTTIASTTAGAEDSTIGKTNPYVVHAQQMEQQPSSNATQTDSDEKPASLFDQMRKWTSFNNANTTQNSNDFNRNQSRQNEKKPASGGFGFNIKFG